MRTMHSTRGKRYVSHVFGVAAAMVALLASAIAEAHFVLKAPANWLTQDSAGAPEKMGPCGNEAPQTPTNAVTPYQPGDQVTIELDEVVFHPGHYRVALAPTQSDLPAEPTVTPTAQDQCASAAVQASPTLPVLADNLLVHTTPFAGTQSMLVALPANPPCTNCVLQVLEFMSSHGAPCFYHHCANITFQGAPGDAGGDTGTSNPGPSTNNGCSCSVPRRESSTIPSLASLAGLAAAIAARRRSRALATRQRQR